MIIYLALFLCGLALSAFFSGTETGMYRVPRVRLVLDALDGRVVARCLLWLANRPTLFVATVLVGNNIANYITSYSVVQLVPMIVGSKQAFAEFVGSILVTPVVFVYGELLPKYLYFNAPNRLLRFSGPILIFATILFLPITLLLGVIGSLFSSFTGRTPFQSRLRIAQSELAQMLREGKDIGLLKASQQQTAENIWHVGQQTAKAFAMPPDRLARIRVDASPEEAVAAARRGGHPLIVVENTNGETAGFMRYAELVTSSVSLHKRLHPTVLASEEANCLEVLFAMNDQKSDIAELHDKKNTVVAVVTRRQLIEPLMTH